MPQLLIGTSGWHYASWRGTFYPPGVGPKRMLPCYAERFATTEINTSFYRVPTAAAVAAWHDAVPDGFVFSWKASRFITHNKKLNDCEESLRYVFGRMAPLAEKMGPVLFQLPPMLKGNRERLARFLDVLPNRHRHVIEFRNPSWYEPAILDLLRDHGVSLCISDHEDAPSPWEATAGHVYARGHGPTGDYRNSYPDATLDRFARAIRGWRKEGRDVLFYFDNDHKAAAPADAVRLIERLRPKRRSA